MSIGFINGAKYAVSALGAAVAVSGISNANPAVASTSTPPSLGDLIVMGSNWSELDGSPRRAGTVVAGTSFQIEGLDTTDTNRFPVGEGNGVYYPMDGFTSITKIVGFEPSGGDQNFYEYQEIDDPSSRTRRIPTNKSAQGWTMTMNYDPDLAWYERLIELDRLKEKVVLRETLPNGDIVLYYGYLSFNKVPTKTPNETMKVVATFSLDTDPVRYAA